MATAPNIDKSGHSHNDGHSFEEYRDVFFGESVGTLLARVILRVAFLAFLTALVASIVAKLS